jgi:hypothetical protein
VSVARRALAWDGPPERVRVVHCHVPQFVRQLRYTLYGCRTLYGTSRGAHLGVGGSVDGLAQHLALPVHDDADLRYNKTINN